MSFPNRPLKSRRVIGSFGTEAEEGCGYLFCPKDVQQLFIASLGREVVEGQIHHSAGWLAIQSVSNLPHQLLGPEGAKRCERDHTLVVDDKRIRHPVDTGA